MQNRKMTYIVHLGNKGEEGLMYFHAYGLFAAQNLAKRHYPNAYSVVPNRKQNLIDPIASMEKYRLENA